MKIAIAGYGNLGRGVECALTKCPDMILAAVFTRRDPDKLKIMTDTPVYSLEDAPKLKGELDAVILCGGSATDLPVQTPSLARYFNVVDSFDTHARIPEHFAEVDGVCRKSGKTAIISAGWDPGLFSVARLIGASVLPNGCGYTFWGPGVSQGHSDAIRRIEGVRDARQYTIPVKAALERVRSGENPTLTTREKHTRECYVVAEEGADLARIENEIKTMPNYFADYDTAVHFISEEELLEKHSGLPHGGEVIRSGRTGFDDENHHLIEFKLALDSNPQFTSSVLVACARAVCRLNREGVTGCKSLLDIPLSYLYPGTPEELRKELL